MALLAQLSSLSRYISLTLSPLLLFSVFVSGSVYLSLSLSSSVLILKFYFNLPSLTVSLSSSRYPSLYLSLSLFFLYPSLFLSIYLSHCLSQSSHLSVSLSPTLSIIAATRARRALLHFDIRPQGRLNNNNINVLQAQASNNSRQMSPQLKLNRGSASS